VRYRSVERRSDAVDEHADDDKEVDDGQYDDVLISTLPKRVSEWLRRDLPGRVRRLGFPWPSSRSRPTRRTQG
jgi:hypothetical protein